MTTIYKIPYFSKWAAKEKVKDKELAKAIGEMDEGLVDANLGGHVYKKRVALANKGKSGGSRVIIAYKINDKAFLLYGFSKSEKSNIDSDDLKIFKSMAKEYLSYGESELKKAVKFKKLIEVKNE
jgi:hypothetical protein